MFVENRNNGITCLVGKGIQSASSLHFGIDSLVILLKVSSESKS